jgi:hypothetical protein
MRRTLKSQLGIGLLEILIAGTILLIVMLGMNAALVSSSLVSRKSKDLTMATNIAQQLVESERARSQDPVYYATLPTSIVENLMPVTGNVDSYLLRYVRQRQATPRTPLLSQNVAAGVAAVITMDITPTSAGIAAGSRLTLFEMATGMRQTVYALSINDGARQFTVDGTAPQQGRGDLTTAFPAGTRVLIASKLLTIQIGMAATNDSDVMATGRSPLITLSTYVNNPLQ